MCLDGSCGWNLPLVNAFIRAIQLLLCLWSTSVRWLRAGVLLQRVCQACVLLQASWAGPSCRTDFSRRLSWLEHKQGVLMHRRRSAICVCELRGSDVQWPKAWLQRCAVPHCIPTHELERVNVTELDVRDGVVRASCWRTKSSNGMPFGCMCLGIYAD